MVLRNVSTISAMSLHNTFFFFQKKNYLRLRAGFFGLGRECFQQEAARVNMNTLHLYWIAWFIWFPCDRLASHASTELSRESLVYIGEEWPTELKGHTLLINRKHKRLRPRELQMSLECSTAISIPVRYCNARERQQLPLRVQQPLNSLLTFSCLQVHDTSTHALRPLHNVNPLYILYYEYIVYCVLFI